METNADSQPITVGNSDISFGRPFCWALSLLVLLAGVVMIPRLGLTRNEMILGVVLMLVLSIQVGMVAMLIEIQHKLKGK